MSTTLKHILLIDDDKETCEMMYMWLGQYGFALTTARTAQEGLRLALWRHFDLYLLGDSPPNGNGEKLCRRLREMDQRTPIVFYSTAADKTSRQSGLAAGAQAYLTKPDDLRRLGSVLARLIDEYGSGGKARAA